MSRQVAQPIAARPLRELSLGEERLEFIPLKEDSFKRTNRAEWLTELKSDTGAAKLAGIEQGELSGRWKITVNWPK